MRREGNILTLILILATGLRLANFTSVPLGPNQDEISNALDVESLKRSGTDHHGAFLPLYFQGFGDYREGPFLYLSLPLSVLMPAWIALRMTSVLVGVATVALVYLLGKRLFGPHAGVWASLFLATNPQHILWSRLGMEVVLVPFAVTLSWLACLRMLGGRRAGPILVSASLAFVIYAGMMGKPAAVILSIVFLAPTLWACFECRVSWVSLVLAAILLILLATPALLHSLSPEGASRFDSIRIKQESPGDLGREITRNYFTYWSPAQQLSPMSEGMPTWPHAPKRGYAEWLALMIGLITLAWPLSHRPPIKGRDPVSMRTPLLVFALFAFLPAAVTETIAPSRVIFAAPVLAVIAGLGISSLRSRLPTPFVASVAGLGVALTVTLVSYDVATGSEATFHQFFWNDERLLMERLASDEGPDRFVDATIPFIEEYVRYARERSVSRWPISWTDWDRMQPQPGMRVLTWEARPTPGWSEVARDGRFKIVEWGSP